MCGYDYQGDRLVVQQIGTRVMTFYWVLSISQQYSQVLVVRNFPARLGK